MTWTFDTKQPYIDGRAPLVVMLDTDNNTLVGGWSDRVTFSSASGSASRC